MPDRENQTGSDTCQAFGRRGCACQFCEDHVPWGEVIHKDCRVATHTHPRERPEVIIGMPGEVVITSPGTEELRQRFDAANAVGFRKGVMEERQRCVGLLAALLEIWDFSFNDPDKTRHAVEVVLTTMRGTKRDPNVPGP